MKDEENQERKPLWKIRWKCFLSGEWHQEHCQAMDLIGQKVLGISKRVPYSPILLRGDLDEKTRMKQPTITTR